MKGTDAFKATIKAYLDDKATTDPLFAKEYQKPDKSLDECVRFVLSEVMKNGCCGMTDDEVYCIVLHYYLNKRLITSC